MRVLLIAALLLPALSACKETPAKKTQNEVVDCQVFCTKTFGTCGREVFIASGKLRVDKAKMFKVLGLLKKVKAEGLEKCHKNCGEQRGVFGDARQVNECLKIPDCEPFAKCITKFVK